MSLLRCAAAACLAAALEIGEAAYFHSRFEWRDVSVDSVGVVAGAVILIFAKGLSLRTITPSAFKELIDDHG